ncbi:MAG: NAD(P)H-dependent oxidoreductase [Bacteroidales bacterium]|nr:NAD(P)H-dependent oxidoreductase [Bacteroidales bacterium]
MKKVLIINAHQKYEGFAEGKLNQTFMDVAKETLEAKDCEVQITYIEKGYDIEEEISKHEWADLVITQTPVYWFGAPWIYKKYIDEVFTAALVQGRLLIDDGRTRTDLSKQYGTGGLAQGKKFLLSSTWNAPDEAFGDNKQILLEGKSLDDALINISIAYKFCGYEILKGFGSFDVMKNPQVESDIKELKERLKELC